jgi:hypothetical protein
MPLSAECLHIGSPKPGHKCQCRRFLPSARVALSDEGQCRWPSKNFGCYNFAYRKDTKAPIISYHTKWPTGWTNEWFYIKADKKKREKLMTMVMSPMSLSFGMTRPLCHMQLGSPCQLVEVEFRVVAAEISTRDLVQEYLANKTFPTSSGWGMLKKKEGERNMSLFDSPTASNLRSN